jgi:hypothetical protein
MSLGRLPAKRWRAAFASVGLIVLLATPGNGRPATETPSPQNPTSVQGVTVESPLSREEKFARALNFIQSHGAPARIGQLARWTDRVCPLTLGLTPALEAFVSARVRLLATRVGAPVRKTGRCRPNVEILFVDRPQALMDAVARERGALLGFHYAAATRRLATVSRPIEARYLTSTRGSAGDSVLDVASGTPMGGGDAVISGPVNLADAGNTPGGCAGSRLTQCLRSLLTNVLIVVNAPAMEGRQIGPIADYIAMLALSQAKSLDDCGALASILDLMAATCSERSSQTTWTDSDIAYLKALYKVDLSTAIALEKDNIAAQMTGAAGASPPIPPDRTAIPAPASSPPSPR